MSREVNQGPRTGFDGLMVEQLQMVRRREGRTEERREQKLE